MKTRSRRNRSVSIPTSRWLAYAGAGAATAITGATSADAEIHYSGIVDVTFDSDSNTTMYLQLDRPGDSIAFRHSTFNGSGNAYFKAVGLRSGAFFGTYNIFSFAFVFRLRGQDRYISEGTFTSGGGTIRNFGLMVKESFGYGRWLNPGTAFVGFRFNNGAGRQYGSACVQMGDQNHNHRFKVIDYAYADPGEPIKPGQTSSSAKDDIPAEGSLEGLALGATGLTLWRQRRKHAGAE
jgi:hypothetical protein